MEQAIPSIEFLREDPAPAPRRTCRSSAHGPAAAGRLALPSKGHEDGIASLLELSLAPTAAAPARARAAVSAWLGRHFRDEALLEIALLLVSELVTNSVRHAELRDGAALQLNAALGATALRIELRDDGTGGTVERRMPRRHEDTGGYGLDLVERLSSGWGVDRDADGTTVWLELPVPFAAPA